MYAIVGGETASRSTDAGATWAPIGVGLPGFARRLRASPLVPATILLARDSGTDGTLWKSTDAGATFAAVGAGLPISVNAIAFHPSDAAVVYAGLNGAVGSHGVYRSTDAGATFANVERRHADHLHDRHGHRPAGPHAPLRHRGGGGPLPLDGRRAPAGRSRIRASPVSTRTTVALAPGTPSTLFVGTAVAKSGQPTGVFKSTDAASSWAPANVGLTALDVSRIAAVPSAAGTLYAGTQAGMFKTTDGGASWTRSSSGIPGTIGGFAARIGGIAVHPTDPSVVYAAAGGNKVYRSTNAGAAWLPLGSGLPTTVGDVAVDPLMPATLYAGGGDIFGGPGGIFKSTDGGDNWSLLAREAFGGWAGLITPSPTTPGTVLAVTSTTGLRNLVRSTNGGATWSDTGIEVVDLAFDPVNASTVYAAGPVSATRLQRSTDNGTTWTPIHDGLPSQVTAVVVHPTEPSTLYAGTSMGRRVPVDRRGRVLVAGEPRDHEPAGEATRDRAGWRDDRPCRPHQRQRVAGEPAGPRGARGLQRRVRRAEPRSATAEGRRSSPAVRRACRPT